MKTLDDDKKIVVVSLADWAEMEPLNSSNEKTKKETKLFFCFCQNEMLYHHHRVLQRENLFFRLSSNNGWSSQTVLASICWRPFISTLLKAIWAHREASQAIITFSRSIYPLFFFLWYFYIFHLKADDESCALQTVWTISSTAQTRLASLCVCSLGNARPAPEGPPLKLYTTRYVQAAKANSIRQHKHTQRKMIQENSCVDDDDDACGFCQYIYICTYNLYICSCSIGPSTLYSWTVSFHAYLYARTHCNNRTQGASNRGNVFSVVIEIAVESSSA